MKKLLLILAVVLACFQACKKSPALATTTQKFQNKWNVQSITDLKHQAGTNDQTTTTPGAAGDYFDFRTDGKLYVSLENGQVKDTSNYTMISDNQFSINGSVLATISTLTSNALIFSVTTTGSGSDYEKTTYNLAR